MPQKILIVDDFKDYAGLLEKKLCAEGFFATVVNDGDEAIQLAKNEQPDLIILDIMMPKKAGTEVRMELIKDPRTKDIPVLFLTGLRAPHSKNRSADGVRMIGKSNDLGELLDAIREILDKTSAKRSS